VHVYVDDGTWVCSRPVRAGRSDDGSTASGGGFKRILYCTTTTTALRRRCPTYDGQTGNMQSRLRSINSDLALMCVRRIVKLLIKTWRVYRLSVHLYQCSRKRVQHLKKRKKSCFWFSKKCKNVTEKRNHLVIHPITQLSEVGTAKSRSPTSNTLLRSVDTRTYGIQLRTVCDKCL